MSAKTLSVRAAPAGPDPTGHAAMVRALRASGVPGPALDALTGLPNRGMLAAWLAEQAAGAARAAAGDAVRGPAAACCGCAPGLRVGLLCLDLDGFRQVNAMLGFTAGDRFLAAVAERLAAVTGPGGHLLARTGGDEFAVLVNPGGLGLAGCRSADRVAAVSCRPGAGASCAPTVSAVTTAAVARVAEHVLAALREPVDVDGRALTVTASIGAVEAPALGAAPEELLRAADLALYWAKDDGRDRWTLFDPERGGADVARYRLAADLPAAVESGQFFCEYQPIVSLADGAVAGVEALVRWHHPRFGMVPPDRFIGLAEDSGLIVELGRQVLAEACRAAASWPGVPGQPAPPVSVNVAVRQMRDPGLTGHVLAALDAVGLPPHRLRLEITESALLPGDDSAAAVLRSLAGRGVHIAVDDFGTGYSNLAHLRRLPLHILKIDGTFVAGLSGDRPGADEQIIATVTALGHALGLSVTAEGVETAEQWQTVRRLGVDTGQGWYFSRALSAAGIRELLASGLPLAA